jgi:hypothetical protein
MKRFHDARLRHRLAVRPPHNLQPPVMIRFATTIDTPGNTGPGGRYPAVTGMKIDRKAEKAAYKRIVTEEFSVRMAEEKGMRIRFEIGGVEELSAMPCFTAFREFEIRKVGECGLIETILCSSLDEYTERYEKLPDRGLRDESEATIKTLNGERILRRFVHGGNEPQAIMINGLPFRTVFEWRKHIEDFYTNSPLARNVSRIALMVVLAPHSDIHNFTRTNYFPPRTTLETLVLVESPVYFAQGRFGGGWVTNRSHLIETVAFEIHTPPQEDRGRAETEVRTMQGKEGNQEDENMGYRSEQEDSGIDTQGALIIACPTARRNDPGNLSVLKKFPNRVANAPAIDGWYTATITFGPGAKGEAKMRAALKACQEPGEADGRHQISGMLAGRATQHFNDLGEAHMLVFNDAPEPDLVYNVIGVVNAIPIAPRVANIYTGGLCDFEVVAEHLTRANEHAIRAGIRPPFLYLMPTSAGPCRELIDREKFPYDPPPGGGYILLEGVSPLISEGSRKELLTSLGVRVKGTWAWVKDRQERCYLRVAVGNTEAYEEWNSPIPRVSIARGQRQTMVVQGPGEDNEEEPEGGVPYTLPPGLSKLSTLLTVNLDLLAPTERNNRHRAEVRTPAGNKTTRDRTATAPDGGERKSGNAQERWSEPVTRRGRAAATGAGTEDPTSRKLDMNQGEGAHTKTSRRGAQKAREAGKQHSQGKTGKAKKSTAGKKSMDDAVEDLVNASKRKGHVTEQILKKFMLAEGSEKEAGGEERGQLAVLECLKKRLEKNGEGVEPLEAKAEKYLHQRLRQLTEDRNENTGDDRKKADTGRDQETHEKESKDRQTPKDREGIELRDHVYEGLRKFQANKPMDPDMLHAALGSIAGMPRRARDMRPEHRAGLVKFLESASKQRLTAETTIFLCKYAGVKPRAKIRAVTSEEDDDSKKKVGKKRNKHKGGKGIIPSKKDTRDAVGRGKSKKKASAATKAKELTQMLEKATKVQKDTEDRKQRLEAKHRRGAERREAEKAAAIEIAEIVTSGNSEGNEDMKDARAELDRGHQTDEEDPAGHNGTGNRTPEGEGSTGADGRRRSSRSKTPKARAEHTLDTPEEEVWETVDKVLEERKKDGKVEYLVSFAGHGGDGNRWLSKEQLECPGALAKFRGAETEEDNKEWKEGEGKTDKEGGKPGLAMVPGIRAHFSPASGEGTVQGHTGKGKKKAKKIGTVQVTGPRTAAQRSPVKVRKAQYTRPEDHKSSPAPKRMRGSPPSGGKTGLEAQKKLHFAMEDEESGAGKQDVEQEEGTEEKKDKAAEQSSMAVDDGSAAAT